MSTHQGDARNVRARERCSEADGFPSSLPGRIRLFRSERTVPSLACSYVVYVCVISILDISLNSPHTRSHPCMRARSSYNSLPQLSKTTRLSPIPYLAPRHPNVSTWSPVPTRGMPRERKEIFRSIRAVFLTRYTPYIQPLDPTLWGCKKPIFDLLQHLFNGP